MPILDVARQQKRVPLRQILNPSIRLQYLIYPYADFHVGTLGQQDSFNIGPFVVWRDTEHNWRQFLNVTRPAAHLEMYVDRKGNQLQTMWIATSANRSNVASEYWQHLTAVLFYLAWARIPYSSPDRAAAEDFYYEAFNLPDGADADSRGHLRWSKYANTYWSDLKIHPAPEVSLHRTMIELPVEPGSVHPSRWSLFFDDSSSERFKALESELRKPASRLLTALWFLEESTYRSASRSTFAEDIQNVCTAFEALLSVNDKGDSARQVAAAITKLFCDQAPTAADDLASKAPDPERVEVLEQLAAWIKKLHEIRNEYTHGKPVLDFSFEGRSVWQDAFEIFRLAADRIILKRPEQRPTHGSKLEKRLMSVKYFDEVVGHLWDRKRWFPGGEGVGKGKAILDEVIRKGQALDPQLVESITSLAHLRQALFNICTVVCRALERSQRQKCDGRDVQELLKEFEDAFDTCSQPRLDTDAYIRAVAPRLTMWVPTILIPGSNRLLYELLGVFRNLLCVYERATRPILNSLAATLP